MKKKSTILTALACLALPLLVEAVVYETIPQALRQAFSQDTSIERKAFYLTQRKLSKADALTRSTGLEVGVTTYYEGRLNGRLQGTVVFDTHKVRTMNETLMIVISPAGKVEKIRLLRFLEPPDYMAPSRWVAQLLGRQLDRDLSLRGDINGLTGATLTARAYTQATRRALALHRLIYKK